jgi:hypothetical protein
MKEKVQEWLIELEAAGVSAADLRGVKKDFNTGVMELIKKVKGDPVAKKRNRLEAKLAAIKAQLEGLKADKTETAE